jgi:ribosomal protein S18 acetylase RimI-like enzyme
MNLEPVASDDPKFRDWLRRYREEMYGEEAADTNLDGYLQALFADQGKVRHVFWGVEGGKKVGFAIAAMSRHWANRGRTQAVVGEFFIYPEYRREGRGRKLADALLTWMREQGAAEIQSSVPTGNVRGIRFWEAVGFQIARYSLVYRPDRPKQTEDDD